MTPKPTKFQIALHKLLVDSETTKHHLTADEIAEKTGYKAESVRTNLSEGHWSRYLIQVRQGVYQVQGVSGTSILEFCRSISQSQRVRSNAYLCKIPVAAALLRKSRENMILALELYNRPSLENRLDGFVVLFCIAWEQLLKARIIEHHNSEEAIFRKVHEGRPRETLSLKDCIEKLGSTLDANVRRNLERIKDLRDKAVHLLMPEAQPVVSRLFQSGVQNFSSLFREFSGQPMLPQQPVGLLTLVGDFAQPNQEVLRESYGAVIGSEVLSLCQRLEEEIRTVDSLAFAIPIQYRLVFSKEPADADITLTKATGAATQAVIIEKPVSHKRSHPHFQEKATALVDFRLKEVLGEAEYLKRVHHPSRADANLPLKFTTNDFEACVFHFKWKEGENMYHHQLVDTPPRHKYSDSAIEHIVATISKDSGFLPRVRKEYLIQKGRRDGFARHKKHKGSGSVVIKRTLVR